MIFLLDKLQIGVFHLPLDAGERFGIILQDTRIEVSRFVTCSHETIQRNVEAFRRAGRPLPEPLNLHPEVDLD